MGESTGDANGNSAKQGIAERITNLGVSEGMIDRIIDLLVAFVILCLLMTWCFFTFTVRYHIITILMLPLLTYFILGSVGFRLRGRERSSRLIYSDIFAVVNIVLLSLYMDRVFVTINAESLIQIVIALVGVGALSEYLCRQKLMYRLTVPAVMLIDTAVVFMSGAPMAWVIAVMMLAPLPFVFCMPGYALYFGYGRVVINGRYVPRTERQATIIRERRAEAARKKREAVDKEKKESRRHDAYR